MFCQDVQISYEQSEHFHTQCRGHKTVGSCKDWAQRTNIFSPMDYKYRCCAICDDHIRFSYEVKLPLQPSPVPYASFQQKNAFCLNEYFLNWMRPSDKKMNIFLNEYFLNWMRIESFFCKINWMNDWMNQNLNWRSEWIKI